MRPDRPQRALAEPQQDRHRLVCWVVESPSLGDGILLELCLDPYGEMSRSLWRAFAGAFLVVLVIELVLYGVTVLAVGYAFVLAICATAGVALGQRRARR